MHRLFGFLLTIVLLAVLAMPAMAATSNPSPASSGYMVLPFTFDRTISATATPIKFKVPFPATVIGVSAAAVTLDATDTTETYTVDVLEGSTSILADPITLAAAGTIYDGVLADTALADEATVSVVLTLGGDTPSLTDLNLVLVLKRL